MDGKRIFLTKPEKGFRPFWHLSVGFLPKIFGRWLAHLQPGDFIGFGWKWCPFEGGC